MGVKAPWEQWPQLWKSESAWLSYVRGGVRKGLWNRYGPKLEFLKSRLEMRDNPNPRSQKRFPKVKMGQCEECLEWFSQKDLEVDHCKGHNSMRSAEEIGSFVQALLWECSLNDYALLCKPCHKNKSYAEAQGISIDEARVIKFAIELCKKKLDKDWLVSEGIVPASNEKARRAQIIEKLMKEEEDE